MAENRNRFEQLAQLEQQESGHEENEFSPEIEYGDRRSNIYFLIPNGKDRWEAIKDRTALIDDSWPYSLRHTMPSTFQSKANDFGEWAYRSSERAIGSGYEPVLMNYEFEKELKQFIPDLKTVTESEFGVEDSSDAPEVENEDYTIFYYDSDTKKLIQEKKRRQ